MTINALGDPDEYHCKLCQFALSPLSRMRGENKGKLLFSITDKDYSIEELVHLDELKKWVLESCAALHIINTNVEEVVESAPTLRNADGTDDPELDERFSMWVSAFRTLRKRYPSMEEIRNWVCVKDGQ
jgi:hypothetical protein